MQLLDEGHTAVTPRLTKRKLNSAMHYLFVATRGEMFSLHLLHAIKPVSVCINGNRRLRTERAKYYGKTDWQKKSLID